jgi:hypothetical protein
MQPGWFGGKLAKRQSEIANSNGLLCRGRSAGQFTIVRQRKAWSVLVATLMTNEWSCRRNDRRGSAGHKP